MSIAAPTPGVLAQAALSEQVFTPSPTPLAGDPASAAGADAATPTPPPADTPTPVPQQAAINDLPTAAPAASTGQYKDGTYKGPEIDAFYGLVQVEAIIQNGRIADVKFLEYPSDRRTSVRINNVAVPWLQQEAIQAQSANVNIISGATLTSEGFIMSLGNALSNAHN